MNRTCLRNITLIRCTLCIIFKRKFKQIETKNPATQSQQILKQPRNINLHLWTHTKGRFKRDVHDQVSSNKTMVSVYGHKPFLILFYSLIWPHFCRHVCSHKGNIQVKVTTAKPSSLVQA